MIEYVWALHDFTPENPDEVPFKAGDRIEVVEKDDQYGDGWWQGRNPEGRVGLFPQSYTTSKPLESLPSAVVDPDLLPAITFPDIPVTDDMHIDETVPDERDRTLSHGERTMQATLTDVQRAIEQLGRTDDGTRSFSFASSHDDTDRSGTETEGGDSEEEGTDDWHRGARQRLAARAQQENEQRQAREGTGSTPTTPLRVTAPPIDVELSDESEDEHEETTKPIMKRRSNHTPDLHFTTQYPHIPEEDEEASVPKSPTTTLPIPDTLHPTIAPSLPSAALTPPVVQTSSTSTESEGGHIEPSEDFIVPSPSKAEGEVDEEELQTATADKLTFPESAELSSAPIVAESVTTTVLEPTPAPSPPSPPAEPIVLPQPPLQPSVQDFRLPGSINPLSPIGVESETEFSTPIAPPIPVPPAQVLQVPTMRAFPQAIKTQESIPFLQRSTSPGRVPSPGNSPSVSSTASIGFSSSAGIQQTLTPATTANMSFRAAGQTEISPIGSQDGGKRFGTHPSEWTLDDVVDWLKSKGFDQGVCDRFIEQEITGDVLLELDANVLKSEVGIVAFGKRVRIINAITELRRPPSIGEAEHPPPQLSNSRTQSLNYGHSHTSSMQSSAQYSSYNNSPMYGGHGFSPSFTQRAVGSSATVGSGSIANPESPMYMHTPDTAPVSPAGVARNGWRVSDSASVNLPPAAIGSEASLGTTRAEGSPSTTVQPLFRENVGLGLGLGLPSSQTVSRAESFSTANGKTSKSRPSNLILSSSDANLKVTAVGSDQSPRGHTSEDRVAMSDSETIPHQDAKSKRRRLFGRSAESSSLKEKAGSIKDSSSRHSKEVTSATPSDGHAEDTDVVQPIRRPSKKGSSEKPADRLSLFGGSFSGTLAKARKPVPRLHSSSIDKTDKSEKSNDHERHMLPTFARIRSDKKSSSRPSTSDGIGLKAREKEMLAPKEPVVETRTAVHSKEKEKHKDPAVLRKRTSSTSDIVARSPAFAAQAAGGVALKPGKSILEQIGTPDHSGWMRKKSDHYNQWKLRYFVLKGPHLYCIKSNDKTETKIKGYINIVGYKVVADENADPGRYGFRIIHDSDKTHFFSHDEQLVIREWMKAMMKATISRDFNNPVVSSSNIPTIPLTVAQAMNPSPRPPSPTARAATQRAHRRDNPNQLSSRDAQVLLMGMPGKEKSTNGTPTSDRQRIDSFFTNESVHSQEPSSPRKSNASPKVPPPRPSREIRRAFSTASTTEGVVVDDSLIEWANSHLPASLQITDPSGSLCSGLALLRLAEDIKGKPSSPPVPDSAFPSSPNDERLDGLFRLFDFLLDNDVKMGTVSINDIRQGKREKIIQLLHALKGWEEKRKAIAMSIGQSPSAFMAGPVALFQ